MFAAYSDKYITSKYIKHKNVCIRIRVLMLLLFFVLFFVLWLLFVIPSCFASLYLNIIACYFLFSEIVIFCRKGYPRDHQNQKFEANLALNYSADWCRSYYMLLHKNWWEAFFKIIISKTESYQKYLSHSLFLFSVSSSNFFFSFFAAWCLCILFILFYFFIFIFRMCIMCCVPFWLAQFVKILGILMLKHFRHFAYFSNMYIAYAYNIILFLYYNYSNVSDEQYSRESIFFNLHIRANYERVNMNIQREN